jgi:polar amino acid transport system substrate-binding protein
MPLVTEDEQARSIAVPLAELNGPHGRLMHDIVLDWHKSGKLLALEKKWGIKPSPFLEDMHAKYKGS